eukprot:CAMPEP_0169445952 /NCGR_PEP_ID=MMETSP1042-20121227/10717_1 /TAXON_ID=464988 /ORGANISM="Hemiselmis andersenii, Strain CCMP1180" /LENGTH=501 /DNA_ID=CAMNT_0009557389 /DNA_START=109 /DNA_END=1610 /DNA_ORIENTATION=+
MRGSKGGRKGENSGACGSQRGNPPAQEPQRPPLPPRWAGRVFVALVLVALSIVPLPSALGDAGIDVSLIEDGEEQPKDILGGPAIDHEPSEWWYDGGITAPPSFTVDSGSFLERVEVHMLTATVESVIFYTVGYKSLDAVPEPSMETGTLYDPEHPVVFTRNGWIKAVAFHLYALDSDVASTDEIRIRIRPPELFVRAGDLRPVDPTTDPAELVPLELDPPLGNPEGRRFEGSVEVFAIATSAVAPFTPNIQLTTGDKVLILAAPKGVGTASIIVTGTTRVKAVAWQEGLDPSDEVRTGLLTVEAGADGRIEGFAGLLGWWDLGRPSFYYGNFSRAAGAGGVEGCEEEHATFVAPAKVRDRQGTLGPATLLGPACKGGVWDLDPEGESACEVHKVLYRADSGCTVRGGSTVIEGMSCARSSQPSLASLASIRNGVGGLVFDPALNRGLFLSPDVDAAVESGRMPLSYLSVELQFVVAPRALAQSSMYGLASVLQADTGEGG